MILNPYIHSLVYAKVFIGVYYLWKHILLLTQKSFNPIIRFLVIYKNTNNFNSTQFKNIKMIKNLTFIRDQKKKSRGDKSGLQGDQSFPPYLGPLSDIIFLPNMPDNSSITLFAVCGFAPSCKMEN